MLPRNVSAMSGRHDSACCSDSEYVATAAEAVTSDDPDRRTEEGAQEVGCGHVVGPQQHSMLSKGVGVIGEGDVCHVESQYWHEDAKVAPRDVEGMH